VSGDEPESLDPAISNGQPEARIYMALYDGSSSMTRKRSAPNLHSPNVGSKQRLIRVQVSICGRTAGLNGDPIDATTSSTVFDALAKETASRNAYLSYYIKYAQAFNEQSVFVRDPADGPVSSRQRL
jgi:hypothetical protein